MRILALNCGSSSVKCALIDAAHERTRLDIHVENIATESARMLIDGAPARDLGAEVDLQAAVTAILAELRAGKIAAGAPQAVVHRIVHGGERFVRPTLLDEEVLSAIEELTVLAPLHNPPALEAIRVARAALPEIPQVAVFDTAFHATLPASAREYALPQPLRETLGIRRFGFHGISHSHVARSVAAHLHVDAQQLRIISCHLGAGASVTAIERGRSVETSMGMTPLEGLVMGTRAGDLDPGILLYILSSGTLDPTQLDQQLNTRSGLVGLTGTKDMREIERRAAQGDELSELTIAMYAHRVQKYIGAYAAVMGGVDAIAFTGGIGENAATIRARSVQRLEHLGVRLDEGRNRDAKPTRARPVASFGQPRSKTRLLVVLADEELAMVRDAAALLHASAAGG
jgi:acetate kinase